MVLEGVGLHTGARARVTLRPCEGPVRFQAGGAVAGLDQLEIVSTARATTVGARGGALRMGTVEHLCAALAGLGVYAGLAVELEGPEMPLLDGGARQWCDAIQALPLPRGNPALRVVRECVIEAGASRYELSPGETVEVEVRLDLDDVRLEPEARWLGDPADFRTRIAPARTFALAREVDELLQRGLARHFDAQCVVVIASDAIHFAGPAFTPDEPARHKLLDLLGDLYLLGGAPLGRIRALRPGHTANARALRRARDEGVLAPA